MLTRVIGRSKRADIVIKDPRISREHCRISRQRSGGFKLEDLDSRNGIFFRGRRVRRARLTVGDVFRVGDTRLIVDADGVHPATTSNDARKTPTRSGRASSRSVTSRGRGGRRRTLRSEGAGRRARRRPARARRVRWLTQLCRTWLIALRERRRAWRIASPQAEKGVASVVSPEASTSLPAATSFFTRGAALLFFPTIIFSGVLLLWLAGISPTKVGTSRERLDSTDTVETPAVWIELGSPPTERAASPDPVRTSRSSPASGWAHLLPESSFSDPATPTPRTSAPSPSLPVGRGDLPETQPARPQLEHVSPAESPRESDSSRLEASAHPSSRTGLGPVAGPIVTREERAAYARSLAAEVRVCLGRYHVPAYSLVPVRLLMKRMAWLENETVVVELLALKQDSEALAKRLARRIKTVEGRDEIVIGGKPVKKREQGLKRELVEILRGQLETVLAMRQCFLDSLTGFESEVAVQRLLLHLLEHRDRDFLARELAALEARPSIHLVPVLIAALDDARFGARGAIRDTLRTLTSKNLGTNADAWRHWWREHRKELL